MLVLHLKELYEWGLFFFFYDHVPFINKNVFRPFYNFLLNTGYSELFNSFKLMWFNPEVVRLEWQP